MKEPLTKVNQSQYDAMCIFLRVLAGGQAMNMLIDDIPQETSFKKEMKQLHNRTIQQLKTYVTTMERHYGDMHKFMSIEGIEEVNKCVYDIYKYMSTQEVVINVEIEG